jgi:hypothetical protein
MTRLHCYDPKKLTPFLTLFMLSPLPEVDKAQAQFDDAGEIIEPALLMPIAAL